MEPKQIQILAKPNMINGYPYYISEEALQSNYKKVKLHANIGNRLAITIGQLNLCLKRANEYENFSQRVIEEATKLMNCKKNSFDSLNANIDFYDFSNVMYNALKDLKKKPKLEELKEAKREEPKDEKKFEPNELKLKFDEQKSQKIFLNLKRLSSVSSEEFESLAQRVALLEAKMDVVGKIVYEAIETQEKEPELEQKLEQKPEENIQQEEGSKELKEAINKGDLVYDDNNEDDS